MEVRVQGLGTEFATQDLAMLAALLRELPAVDSLELLFMGCPSADDVPPALVASVPNLRSLSLSSAEILPGHFSALSKLTDLSLALEESTALPAGLSRLQALQSFSADGAEGLEDRDLQHGEEVVLDELQALAACPHLTAVRVGFLWLEDLAWVRKLTQLTNLDLSTCWALGYAEEGWLDDGTPAWVGSDFGPAEQREFAAKEYDWALRPLTQLQSLMMSANLNALPSCIAAMSQLTSLEASCNDFASLPSGPYQQSLQHLSFYDCSSLQMKQLLPVLEGMHQLRALNLKHVPLSEEQRRELRERLPRCSIEF